MTLNGIITIAIFIIILILIAKPFGIYIKKVLCCEKTFLDKLLIPIEKGIYKICGIDPEKEQSWKEYLISLLLFSLFGFIFFYIIQIIQANLPFNPQHFSNVPSLLSFNTAVSFVTNTNWQAYSGENTLSYLSQMMGCTVQNFVSAGTGIAVAAALIRAFMRKEGNSLGNFWRDLTRSTLWILLPLSIVISIIYIWQGVPQNLSSYIIAHTIDAGKQIIAQGPVASQEAIKSLGTNGGGFFGANSMHPYENPTALTNFIQVLSIFSIGTALVYAFGLMIKNKKQGWTILISMLILFTFFTYSMYFFESQGNPAINKADHITASSQYSAGRNMEGKETRFGIADSVLYASVTTSASDGGVNAQMESLNPLSGGIAMFNMGLGELIIGGVGTGLYNMIMFILLTVFLAGLMVGRSPEFLGKKIEVKEIKWAIIAIIISPFLVLIFTAVACFTPSIANELMTYGAHGFSRVLYAFISASNNNGSAFGSLNVNTAFFNTTTALAMIGGRFISIAAVLCIAGSLVRKKRVPVTSGTFPTTGGLFIIMLIVCILIIGGLTLFPAIALGPIAEHFMLF